MNLEIALSRYRDVHERILPAFKSEFTKENLTRSYEKLNPPLWIMWHMARTEDFGINRLACDGVQEFIENDWMNRMGIQTKKMGTGMSKKEVTEICTSLNQEEMEKYRIATFQRNLETVARIQNEDLSTTWDDDYLNKVLFDEGILDSGTTNILPVYQGKTREWYLIHTLVAHSFYHLGQLSIIKQLLT